MRYKDVLFRESDDIFGYARENNLKKLATALEENKDLINTKDEDVKKRG
jgi:hypothetical protein